jgi:hypothetical protein
MYYKNGTGSHITPEHISRQGETVEDFTQGGREAGEKAGQEFRSHHPLLSTVDPNIYINGLIRAMEEACTQMEASGASLDKILAWRKGFQSALNPHLEAVVAARR